MDSVDGSSQTQKALLMFEVLGRPAPTMQILRRKKPVPPSQHDLNGQGKGPFSQPTFMCENRWTDPFFGGRSFWRQIEINPTSRMGHMAGSQLNMKQAKQPHPTCYDPQRKLGRRPT